MYSPLAVERPPATSAGEPRETHHLRRAGASETEDERHVGDESVAHSEDRRTDPLLVTLRCFSGVEAFAHRPILRSARDVNSTEHAIV